MTPRERNFTIIREIAMQHGVTVETIMGRSRDPQDVRARWAAYAAVKHRRGLSHCAVGRVFGRDHSTILHGIRNAGGDGVAGITAGLI